jgi:hypothetical protein
VVEASIQVSARDGLRRRHGVLEWAQDQISKLVAAECDEGRHVDGDEEREIERPPGDAEHPVRQDDAADGQDERRECQHTDVGEQLRTERREGSRGAHR